MGQGGIRLGSFAMLACKLVGAYAHEMRGPIQPRSQLASRPTGPVRQAPLALL